MRMNDGVAFPEGPVTLTQAVAVREAGDELVSSGCQAFDLSGVTQVDSSVLSVLLAWKRLAISAGSTLAFRNLPPSILSLIELYGVGELITP